MKCCFLNSKCLKEVNLDNQSFIFACYEMIVSFENEIDLLRQKQNNHGRNISKLSFNNESAIFDEPGRQPNESTDLSFFAGNDEKMNNLMRENKTLVSRLNKQNETAEEMQERIKELQEELKDLGSLVVEKNEELENKNLLIKSLKSDKCNLKEIVVSSKEEVNTINSRFQRAIAFGKRPVVQRRESLNTQQTRSKLFKTQRTGLTDSTVKEMFRTEI